MSLRRLMTTRLAGSGRVTTDMSEAARILFCWHFCWHSRVEDFQIIAAHAVQIGGEGRNRTGLGAFRHFLSPSAMSSPPEACSLKAIEHPYTQAFPPFCQAPLLRTNKPSNTQQLLSQNSFTGTFTGTFSLLRLEGGFSFGNFSPMSAIRVPPRLKVGFSASC